MIDLAAALPRLLPLAIPWVQSQEANALATGRPLTVTEASTSQRSRRKKRQPRADQARE